VPFLTHVHNLFLQIWLEQGVVGFVAFLWMVAGFYLGMATHRQSTVNRQPSMGQGGLLEFNWLMWGGVAAVTVMLAHGMVDVLLYSSRGLPLLLVPFGIAVANGQWSVDNQQNVEHATRNTERGRRSARHAAYWLPPAAFFLLLLASLVLLSPLQAMLFANLGSVEQTRVELGQYHWPDRLVESTRSDPKVSSNYHPPISSFQRALKLDAGNVTANQRLAAIALAQGSYGDAHALLVRAYRRDPSNKVTNQLIRLASNR
jgi:hypothetical protein